MPALFATRVAANGRRALKARKRALHLALCVDCAVRHSVSAPVVMSTAVEGASDLRKL